MSRPIRAIKSVNPIARWWCMRVSFRPTASACRGVVVACRGLSSFSRGLPWFPWQPDPSRGFQTCPTYACHASTESHGNHRRLAERGLIFFSPTFSFPGGFQQTCAVLAEAGLAQPLLSQAAIIFGQTLPGQVDLRVGRSRAPYRAQPDAARSRPQRSTLLGWTCANLISRCLSR